MALPNVYIVSAARTPIGAFQGALAPLAAPRLGAIAIEAAVTRAGIAKDLVGEVYMGHVLTAGVGQAPARQAAIYAGIPNTVPATTVGKVCGSGLMSVVLGAKSFAQGAVELKGRDEKEATLIPIGDAVAHIANLVKARGGRLR